MTTQEQPVVRLAGLWLLFARAVWVAMALLTVGTLAYASFLDHTFFSILEGWTAEAYGAVIAQLGVSARSLDLFNLATATIIRVTYIAISAVIFWWGADDLMAVLLSIVLLAFSVTAVWVGAVATEDPLLARPIDFLQVVGQTGLILLLFIFPDGRFVPRWARWPTIATLAAFVLARYSPWFLELLGSTPLFWVTILWMVASLPLQIYRYRRVSSPMQRQQTKWAVVGFAGFILLATGGWVVSFGILPAVFPALQEQSAASLLLVLVRHLVQMVGYLALPVCLAIAILRYRLYDIDVVIRKTLLYTVLTVLLGLVYFGSVILLQRLFGAVTGIEQSRLAVVVSTLAIAALFTPLRRRIQNAIDRRFFRKKYDAQQVLAKFAITARDETDLDALLAELMRVVDETLQPEHVSVWLRETKSPKGG